MSNSSLAKYFCLSPNRTSPRNHRIDTITIHCTAGQCTVEGLGGIFEPVSRQASCNYGIAQDGKIGMYCEEKDRSWCTSSAENDNRAVTIEVSSDNFHPYKVSDAAYASLLNLVTDICRRNGIKKLVWSTNKADRVNHRNGCNMTVHRDYANKSCPGDYLYNLHGKIADEVNKRLGISAAAAPTKNGDYTGKFAKGDTVIYNGNVHYTYSNSDAPKPCKGGEAVVTAVFPSGKHPYSLVRTLSGGATVWGWVDECDISPAGEDTEIHTGNTVRVRQGARDYKGVRLAAFVYNRDHIVKSISGDKAVITYCNTVVAAVKTNDLIKVKG